MDFTVEEINLMCIYDTSSREALLYDLSVGLRDVYDPEMISIFKSLISKLGKLTSEGFIEVGFYIADNFFVEDVIIGR